MDFFSNNECRQYFGSLSDKMKKEISSITDKEIVGCDVEEWKEYLYSKYSVAPIRLFEENVSRSLSERKIKQYNHWFQKLPNQMEYYEVDGYCISFRIYYDGDPELLQLKPSTRIMCSFPTADFAKPIGDQCGYFILELIYVKKDIESHSDPQIFIAREFENEFKNYRQMVQYVNTEVNTYNSSVKTTAEKLLVERKEKASAFSLLSQKLEIPIKLSSNAPNIKPIPLTRINRMPPQKPEFKQAQAEYGISEYHYANINNIIAMCGTTMEKTARTYYKNDEEELRDHLLAALNTHYDNATGETFRKIGKTDIHIEFESKAAFIGECKIWHGDKLFTEAVKQLMNYSTWKDTKVSIIIFNKGNKSFQGILSRIEDWIKINTKSFVQIQKNIWKCRYYRSDMKIEIDLNITAFDLYVDETQFRDS